MIQKSNLNIETLGQVFTPDSIVNIMLSLRKNEGSILEPSCGSGAFFNKIPNCVGIEKDKSVCPSNALNMDFFDYPISNKYNTIIGNPPYVKFQSIDKETKSKLSSPLFDNRSNLYLFFIEKCIRHLEPNGELIFIVPRDFLKATSSRKLNEFIYDTGTITDFMDLGDNKIFSTACPNCVIFRFEKDNFNRTLNNGTTFLVRNGQIYFQNSIEDESCLFSNLFFVKVGAVSGADTLFEHPNGNREFVCSKTCKTGYLRRMFYNVYADELLPHKEVLIKRKIRNFNETNWFEWGRGMYESNSPRIYVNSKTRNERPFFVNDCKNYDGSILAIFTKKDINEVQCWQIADVLNGIDWDNLGFRCNGRFLFTQRSLENCILPKELYDKLNQIITAL